MAKTYCDKCFKEIEVNSDHQDWCPKKNPEKKKVDCPPGFDELFRGFQKH
jgi:hypothetical protein